MTLYEAVFGEAVDRSAQQKRLNKVIKPLTRQKDDLELKRGTLGAFHPSQSDVSLKLGNVEDSLERAKKLKNLVTARTKRDEKPDDEKLQRKVDNADDARQPWRGRAWPRKTSLW